MLKATLLPFFQIDVVQSLIYLKIGLGYHHPPPQAQVHQ
jgi:hypothetical protein